MAIAEPGPLARQTARPLIARYSRKTGEAMVYGGVTVGVLLTFISFITDVAPVFGLALAAFLVAAFFYPYLDTHVARLAVNADGLFLSGIGLIPWREIEGIAFRTYAVRTLVNPTLLIALSEQPERVVESPDVPRGLRRYMTRLWRPDGPTGLRIPLQTLDVPHQEVLAAIRQFRHVD